MSLALRIVTMTFPAKYSSSADLLAAESRRHEWRSERMQRLWSIGRVRLPRSLDSDLEPNVRRSSGSEPDSIPDQAAIEQELLRRN